MANQAKIIMDAVARAEAGQSQPGDEEILREALKGLAPSSPTYQKVSQALGPASPYQVSGQDRGMFGADQSRPESGGGLGLPTLDFASGLGEFLGNIGQGNDRGPTMPFIPEIDAQNRGADFFPNPSQASIPNNTPPPTTPDDGPDTINDPRQHNQELIEDRMETPYSDIPGDPMYGRFGYTDVDELSPPEPNPMGYSFSNMRPGDVSAAYNDPQLMMRLIASDAGQGPASEAMMMPYLESARALTGMGVLGGGGGDDGSFMDTEVDPNTSFRLVEDFMDTFNQPGMQFLDQGELHRNILERAGNEDWSARTDQQGNPWGHDEIVAMTNDALFASTPFMTPEGAAALSSRLNAAGLEYKQLVMTGQISMSYPDYLKNVLNASEWFE